MDAIETQLLARWQRHGDPEAFAEIVTRHGSMVYATCKRVLRDPVEAEDVAQECFIALMRMGSSVHTSLAGWLHSAAVCRSLDRIKADTRRRTRETRFAERQPSTLSPDIGDVLAHVDEAMAALPEKLRQPLVLRYLQGCSHEIIARQLDIAEPTVRYRLKRGIERLRNALKRRDVLISSVALALALEQSAEAAPSSLYASLGKLALAGKASLGTPSAAATAASGTALLTKSVAVGLLLVMLGVAGMFRTSRLMPHKIETKDSAASSTVTTAEAPRATAFTPAGSAPLAQATPAAAFTSSIAPSSPAPVPAGVRGRVYDTRTGKGIADAVVLVESQRLIATAQPVGSQTIPKAVSISPEGNRGTARTDENGFFEICGLKTGSYHVDIASPGYISPPLPSHPIIPVTNGATDKPLELPLEAGVPISGVVLSADGHPVADARVNAQRPNMKMGSPFTTQSEKNGAFTLLVDVPTDAIIIQAETGAAESEILGPAPLTVAGLTGVSLKLKRLKTASIAGTVVGPTGVPATQVKVTAHLPWSSDYLPPLFLSSAKVDDHGAFEIKGLASGSYIMSVGPASGATVLTPDGKRVEVAESESKKGVRLVYGGDDGGLFISGRVADSAGKPIDGATVSVNGPSRGIGYSGSDGSFRLGGLSEGAYTVCADHQNYSALTHGVEATAGSTDIELVLKGFGTIVGRVVRDDTAEPLTQFEVSFINGAYDKFSPGLFQNANKFADPRGQFLLEKVHSDDVTVSARADGFAPAFQSLVVQEHTSSTIELRLKPAKPWRGRVIDTAGKPIAGAFIFYGGFMHMMEIERTSVARSAADGSFTIPGLSPDAEYVCGYRPDKGVGAVRVGEQNSITLPEPGSLEGTVQRPSDWQDPAFVSVDYEDRPYLPYTGAATDANGVYRIGQLTPGPVTISVRERASQHLMIALATIEPGKTTHLDIASRSGSATVSGSLVLDGVPIRGGIELKITSANRSDLYSLRTNEAASFNADGLPDGHATLDARTTSRNDPKTARTRRIEFDIAPGATIVQDIDISDRPE